MLVSILDTGIRLAAFASADESRGLGRASTKAFSFLTAFAAGGMTLAAQFTCPQQACYGMPPCPFFGYCEPDGDCRSPNAVPAPGGCPGGGNCWEYLTTRCCDCYGQFIGLCFCKGVI